MLNFIFQGGPENIDLARAHYSYAILLNPNNIRALYGLYLVRKCINEISTISNLTLYLLSRL